ncbi:hypothetical protein P43SY_008565 [Pythium insidiosum]|uniref:Uncharacterized protein n=1 Tax=Pythium insidiosum TaxID=114742 RepID=A0AAD5LLQ0_PYTIN|nr:hypothetical protein P43SY_008565 [Pythium insidiosum]
MYNLLESVVPEYDYAGVIRECSGSTITGIVPSNTYVSRDKKNVVVAANTDTLFVKLMLAIGRDDMANDPKTKVEINSAMEQAEIPVGYVYSVEDMMKDPHFHHRGMFEEVPLPSVAATDRAKTLKIPAILPKLASTPGRTDWAGRQIGEDTREVLRDVLGRSDADVDLLVAESVVFEPTRRA